MSYDASENFGKIAGTTGIKQIKIHSYGYLYKNLQLLDLFLTYLNSKRHLILQSFTLECLEKFKPVVDTLFSELNQLQVIDPVRVKLADYLMRFLVNFRDRTTAQLSGSSIIED
jgi:hypothetical protein